MKIRFLEPGNRPYRKSIQNYFVYDRYIRTPSNGILTLATILKREYEDVFCYSESISKIVWKDVLDADIIFISIFTFAANRGYELASYIRKNSNAVIVFGGLHATLNYQETVQYADYVLLGEGDASIGPLVHQIGERRKAAGTGEAGKRQKAAGVGETGKRQEITVPGVVYLRDGELIRTGEPLVPVEIDTIPDRNLMYRFRKMTGHNTIWAQVHASRGCPHRCDYCALVVAFGQGVRVRSPEAVVEDIRQAIDFFDRGHIRLAKMLWLTDDNFFADRKWAMTVLQAIIDSGIRYRFTIQARYEVGFDDEMLKLLKEAGFIELAMGIEFLEDEAFEQYHKKSTYQEILRSVKNIQRHGLRVRGLFIVGADNQEPGVGERLADFVIEQDIAGVLIQSMYFIPGTPVYETHRDVLLEEKGWDRCNGKVVHRPRRMTSVQLQQEIITASARIYSPGRLLKALVKKRGLERLLFFGEFLWQASVRRDLKKDLEYLKGKQ